MTRRFWKCKNKNMCRMCGQEKEIPKKFIEHGDYICTIIQ